jgi:hypothetical protein
MAFAYCSSSASAQPPNCIHVLYCLFNQEAAASDPAGVHRYSEDLIGAIVQNPAGSDSFRRLTNQLADRLASAEQTARAGDGKLVPEAAVVKAFNDLMQQIGAPSSMKASEASVHEFREHAASIDAFPALFSADRNGTNCNPGEAVFLLSLLLSDNGALHEGNLDASLMLLEAKPQPRQPFAKEPGVAVAGIESMSSSASGMLSWYSLHHSLTANAALFDHLAVALGF